MSITKKGWEKRRKNGFGQAWNKGKKGLQKHSNQTKLKMSLSHSEEKHWDWKGDKVGYAGVHDWIEKWKGKPNFCEKCGLNNQKKYEWANIDHKYRRVLEDYIRMCTTCHRNYDKDRGIKVGRF